MSNHHTDHPLLCLITILTNNIGYNRVSISHTHIKWETIILAH